MVGTKDGGVHVLSIQYDGKPGNYEQGTLDMHSRGEALSGNPRSGEDGFNDAYSSSSAARSSSIPSTPVVADYALDRAREWHVRARALALFACVALAPAFFRCRIGQTSRVFLLKHAKQQQP